MSQCSCGINSPPKPIEEEEYASIDTAYDTLKENFSTKKKYSTFEYFLIIVIIIIVYHLIKDLKC